MKLFSPRGAEFLPHAGGASAVADAPHDGKAKRRLSVKTSLRLAFGIVLAGTIALTQIGRLNGATQSMYTQGVVASRAAEEALAWLLRVSRSQKTLLTATTAKERDDLGAQIDQALKEIATDQTQLAQYASTQDAADADASAEQHCFATALAKWSDNLRGFVKLVKEQLLDLSQMNWQVGTQDVSLLVGTGKVEKMVDALVARRAAAKSTIDSAEFIFHSFFAIVMALTLTLALALLALAIAVSENGSCGGSRGNSAASRVMRRTSRNGSRRATSRIASS